MSGDDTVEVHLRFSPEAAPFVRERNWHSSQVMESDHGGCLSLRVEIADPREMLPWIRSWGAQVEVLGPDWLRERVAEDLQNAAQIYHKEKQL